MLPKARKVAQVIRAVFMDPEEKAQKKDLDRDVQVRMGRARILRHINRQQQLAAHLTTLAKRALALNNESRFKQAAQQLLWARRDIHRWEQYALSLDLLEARRDQVKASVEMLQSAKAMSESLQELEIPESVDEIQKELELGLARAASVEERLEIMMDMLNTTLDGGMQVDEHNLTDLESSLAREIASEETAAFTPEIQEGLEKVRAELEKK